MKTAEETIKELQSKYYDHSIERQDIGENKDDKCLWCQIGILLKVITAERKVLEEKEAELNRWQDSAIRLETKILAQAQVIERMREVCLDAMKNCIPRPDISPGIHFWLLPPGCKKSIDDLLTLPAQSAEGEKPGEKGGMRWKRK